MTKRLGNIFQKKQFRISEPLALLEWILLGILTAALGIVLLFWYRHFYQTITQAEIILVLSREVALQDIRLEQFTKALAVHQFKQSNLLPKTINDPFVKK